MSHWLVKQEPEAYSFTQFRKDKKTSWTGVRNFQARNFLREMKVGDEVFFYHSVSEKAIVGMATVAKTAYPDPTVEADDIKRGEWLCVDLKVGAPLPAPISLEQIKQHPALKEIGLVKQSRLSVMPVTAKEANVLRKLGGF